MESPKAQHDPVVATRSLTAALTTLADALTRADVNGVLEAEPALTTALAAMSAAGGVLVRSPRDETTRKALAAEMTGARKALARCAALGVSLDLFVRGRGYGGATYNRAGNEPLVDVRTAREHEA